MSGYKHDCALGSGEERRRALTTGNGQWGKTDFLRQAEEGVGVEEDPESTQGRLYARGNTTWRRVFVPPSLFPRMSVVPVARFSSSLRMLGRGYLILISLWEFLGSRNLGFLFYHCARQDGGAFLCPFSCAKLGRHSPASRSPVHPPGWHRMFPHQKP